MFGEIPTKYSTKFERNISCGKTCCHIWTRKSQRYVFKPKLVQIYCKWRIIMAGRITSQCIPYLKMVVFQPLWIDHDLQWGWYNRSGVTQTYYKNVWESLWQNILAHQIATHLVFFCWSFVGIPRAQLTCHVGNSSTHSASHVSRIASRPRCVAFCCLLPPSHLATQVSPGNSNHSQMSGDSDWGDVLKCKNQIPPFSKWRHHLFQDKVQASSAFLSKIPPFHSNSHWSLWYGHELYRGFTYPLYQMESRWRK